MKSLKSMIQTDESDRYPYFEIYCFGCKSLKKQRKLQMNLRMLTAERVAYVMSSDKPKVVEEAVVPKYPSSPNTKKNTASGVALAFAFVAASCYCTSVICMNDTIQT